MKNIFKLLILTTILIISCEGPEGPIGPSGSNGQDGSNGTNGNTGATGSTGSTGSTGATGSSGINGADGALQFFFADFSVIPSEFDQSTSDNANWGLWQIDFTIGANDLSGNNLAFGSLDISDNQLSVVSIPFTNDQPSLIEFDVIISSESCCDFLKWSLNGSVINGLAGEGGPYHIAFEAPAGSNTLAFTYDKDGSVSTANDDGWIDNLRILNITGAGRYDTSLPEIGDWATYYTERETQTKN